MDGKAASLLAAILVWSLVAINGEQFPRFGPLVTRECRRTLVTTDSGLVTAVDVSDGCKRFYHLQFITMEPGSLFLPVLLHTDMVFYVQTGRGTVSYTTGDGTTHVEVEGGDIYGLEEGTIFYVRSHPDPKRGKLRINAIFDTATVENPTESFVGVYSNITDLVRGFDDHVLEMGFGVSEEIVRSIKWVKTPPIIPFPPKKNESNKHDWEDGIFESLIGLRSPTDIINKKKKKKKKTQTFNIYSTSPDVENCNGWSTAVTGKQIPVLKGRNFGVFLVNLTKGSMMGPHWNPRATEIAVVIEGQGMVQVVCPSKSSGEGGDIFECQNMKFRVKEGDVFVALRYHPMAQISFNNNSFVFMGFSTMVKNNHPQFLVGERSVLNTIDREILEVSFNSSNTMIETLLTSQRESIMLECTSCAEELEKKVEEEIERQKQEEEEARKRREEEEEARRREEEEARRREEEEEARRREEEEARRREEEEEARRKEEETRRREEEEASRREEEEASRREEEEEARRKEEETRRREEEEARRREEEEEARRKEEETRRREEEEKRKQEEEEARREEEEAKRREEEEVRKREEEEAKKREEEARRREEAAAREQEEKEAKRREEEEAARKRGEREAKREEEEATRAEGEEQEARRREEEGVEKEAEAAARKREEEEAKRREKEESRRNWEEEGAGKREEEGGGRREEEEPNVREREEEHARKSEKHREKAYEREVVDERREKWRLREAEDEEGRALWKKMWRV